MAINNVLLYIFYLYTTYMISNKNLCLLIWFRLFTINIPGLLEKQFLVLEHENQQKIREKCNLFIRFFLSGLAEDFSDMTADCDELLLQVSVDFEAVVTRISHHNVAVGG